MKVPSLKFQAALVLTLALLFCEASAATVAADNNEVRATLSFRWQTLNGRTGGYFPVRIRIDNRVDRDRTWLLRSEAEAYGDQGQRDTLRSEQPLEVPAKASRSFELLVPYRDFEYHSSMEVRLTGPGEVASSDYFSGDGRNQEFFIGGLSPRLFVNGGSSLPALSRSHQEVAFEQLKLTEMSEDWRAYLGFDAIWFAEADWQELGSAARAALANWVFAGGHLRILTSAELGASFADLPEGGARRDYGLGSVRVFTGTPEGVSHSLDAATTESASAFYGFQKVPLWGISRNELLGSGANDDAFFAHLPAPEVNFALIILLVIAFALLVGPVNFFIFAPGRKRWRVFLSIPLLSIGFTLFLLAAIALSEGVGGRGQLSRLVLIDSVRKVRYLGQIDLSRTGLLMQTRFDLPPGADYRHGGAALTEGHEHRQGRRVLDAAGNYSGSYFSSRSLQYNQMRQIESTREAVVLLPPEVEGLPPRLRSNLQASLRETFYVDDAGEVWRAEAVGVGQTVTLEPSDSSTLFFWLQAACDRGGFGSDSLGLPRFHFRDLQASYEPTKVKPQEDLLNRRGWFYSLADPLPEVYPEPHNGLHWEDFQTLMAGPVLTAL